MGAAGRSGQRHSAGFDPDRFCPSPDRRSRAPARAEQRTPLRRIGEPNDIAGVALFLASDAAAYVTGQTIVDDGGETIS